MKKPHEKLILVLLAVIPFLLGLYGYIAASLSWGDAAYASFVLYFANPIRDEVNGAVILARWTAPITTVAAAVTVIRSFGQRIGWFLDSLSQENVVVYEDNDTRIAFPDRIRAVYPGDRFIKNFHEQIILFSTDEACFQFYHEHEEQLRRKNVYLGLHDLEPGLLKSMQEDAGPGSPAGQVMFFDINRSIARLLWKKIALWRRPDDRSAGREEEISIAIYGNGGLPYQILSTGLQLNLFSEKQKITYHMISDDHSFERRHYGMLLMNEDEILYHTTDSDAAWEAIRSCDYMIIAEQPSAGLLQDIVVNSRKKVYYYSPVSGGAGENIDRSNLFPFCRDEEVFTDENIRHQKLIEKAVRTNDEYNKNYPGSGQPWEKLSGFYKESNISSADYQEVLHVLAERRGIRRRNLLQSEAPGSQAAPGKEELIRLLGDEKYRELVALAQLEHIRWCRFYYLNYWTYAPIEGKDKARRLHHDLVPFEDLTEGEQMKDVYNILLSL